MAEEGDHALHGYGGGIRNTTSRLGVLQLILANVLYLSKQSQMFILKTTRYIQVACSLEARGWKSGQVALTLKPQSVQFFNVFSYKSGVMI